MMRSTTSPLPLYWQSSVCSHPSGVDAAYCLDTDSFDPVPAHNAPRPAGADPDFAVLCVSLQMRGKLARAGIHPIVNDSPWHFEPSLLMAHCPQRLLSENMFILPFGNLTRRRAILPRFFIRPNSGNKSFPGQVINFSEIETLKRSYAIRDETLVCIASERPIRAERRCIIDVTEGRIIAQTRYAHDNKPSLEFTVDYDRDWRGLIPTDLLPDVVVADFALTNDGVRLIELNSISTSGLYDIPPEVIYNHLNNKRSLFL